MAERDDKSSMSVQPSNGRSSWRVLLIGGSSGVGKTMVARDLARHLGISVLQADDVRMAIQQVTMPGEQPGIHYFLAHPMIWQKPPEALCEGWINVAQAMLRPLSATIAPHLYVESAGPVIIEGDGILPALAALRSFSTLHFPNAPITDAVRAVFLVEQDEAALLSTLLERGFGEFSHKEQEAFARGSWLYGQWLRRQAAPYDLPVIASRPWESLAERVLQAIER